MSEVDMNQFFVDRDEQMPKPKLVGMEKAVMGFHQELVRVATSALFRANGMLRQAGIPLRYEVTAHDTSMPAGGGDGE